jgi:hypothetical protein
VNRIIFIIRRPRTTVKGQFRVKEQTTNRNGRFCGRIFRGFFGLREQGVPVGTGCERKTKSTKKPPHNRVWQFGVCITRVRARRGTASVGGHDSILFTESVLMYIPGFFLCACPSRLPKHEKTARLKKKNTVGFFV